MGVQQVKRSNGPVQHWMGVQQDRLQRPRLNIGVGMQMHRTNGIARGAGTEFKHVSEAIV